MKLGTKIGAGFAALIIIALALGGLAVWSMSGVKTIANTLANANVPEVAVANEVERDSLSTMYDTRGYTYTEEKAFLDKARTNLEQVKKDLKDAKEHAVKFNLFTLKQNADKAETKALEYEQLLNDTVAKTDAMQGDIKTMGDAATKYFKSCEEYVESQVTKMNEEIAADNGVGTSTSQPAVTTKAMKERLLKIQLANGIIQDGTAIRMGVWRAISTRNPKLLQETQKGFDQVFAKLDQIKAMTVQEVNLKQIEDCRAASKAYSDNMTVFLNNWFAREELNKKRGEVADAVLAAAQDTAKSGMDDTVKASNEA
ncbi:MAG: chemotaxis protein, partial [Planctomycetaceae bacterium]